MKQSVKQKEWKEKNYLENKEAHRAQQQQRRKDIRIFIDTLKTPCLVCGEDEKACIDFHHVNSTEKDFQIADAGQRKWSNERIKSEVDKCVCLCSNHHRILHFYGLSVDELIEKYKKRDVD